MNTTLQGWDQMFPEYRAGAESDQHKKTNSPGMRTARELTEGFGLGNSINNLLQFTPGSPAPAIQLNSTAAASMPEPASGILIGSTLLLLLATKLHRSR
jgi:hypothetical protein